MDVYSYLDLSSNFEWITMIILHYEDIQIFFFKAKFAIIVVIVSIAINQSVLSTMNSISSGIIMIIVIARYLVFVITTKLAIAITTAAAFGIKYDLNLFGWC